MSRDLKRPVFGRPDNGLRLLKAVSFCGLAVWISIAVLNNLVDHETNRFLLSVMVSMQGLIDDPVMGNGLESRAWSPDTASLILRLVIVYQLVLVGLLFLAAYSHVKALLQKNDDIDRNAMSHGNVAIISILIMLFSFLSGGMWFGYWIKMGQVQNVHLTLLLLMVSLAVLNNTKNSAR